VHAGVQVTCSGYDWGQPAGLTHRLTDHIHTHTDRQLLTGYHALIKLVLYVVRFAAGNLETVQSFLDVFQQVLDVRQLAVEICRSLELDELRRHLTVMFLSHK